MTKMNKKGRVFFALSLYCFLAIIAFTLLMLGEIDPDALIPSDEFWEESDVFGVFVAETYILLLLAMLGTAALAVLPVLFKIFQAARCKLKLLGICIFFDYLFLIIGGAITLYLVAIFGGEISTANLWSVTVALLSLLALILDKKGKKKIRRAIIFEDII